MYIERLPSGRYRAVVQYKGVKRSVTAVTRAAAQVSGAQLLIEMGANRGPRNMTVGEMVAGHVTEMTASSTTLADWNSMINRLPTSIMDRQISTVNVVVVGSWWKQLANAGWSPHRIKRAHTIFSSAFANACRLGIMESNPCTLSRPPAPKRKDITIPTHAEVRSLLAAPGDLGVLFRLAATTGARRGELVALQWQDIDLDRSQLVIRRSLLNTAIHGVEERGTKTGDSGHRVVTIDLPTMSLLRSLQRRQLANRMATFGDRREPVWLFSWDGGATPWRPDYVSSSWAKWRATLPVEFHRIKLHHLRHYVATTMLQDGVSLHEVASQLGHSSESTTASAYAHYVEGRNRAAIDRLAARLDVV